MCSAHLTLVRFPARSPLPIAALPAMSLIPIALSLPLSHLSGLPIYVAASQHAPFSLRCSTDDVPGMSKMCRECRMTKEASKNLIVIGQLLLAITLAEVRDREARSPAREGACAPQ